MNWWRRKQREEDLERELRDHLESEARDLETDGLSSEEAQLAARRSFGNSTLVTEEVREMWGWMWMERLWQDLRYGGRGLFRSPVFTLVSVLSLALGIGATVTIVGVFEAVFLNGVTAKDRDRVKHVEIGGERFSYRFFEELATTDSTLVGVAAFDQVSLSFRVKESPEKIAGDVVSRNFFDVLGVAPFLGRTFAADEGVARRPRTVVLSYGFWERKFASDSNVLGSPIELNRETFTIIGVLPKGYRSVHGYGITPDLYIPASEPFVDLSLPGTARFQLIARLKDGIAAVQAIESMNPILQQRKQRYPTENRGSDRVELYSLTGIEKMQKDGVPVELTLFFGFLLLTATLVLLIACANVAGLLLARGANRSREIAVRLALGAGRGRLLQQLLTESFLLALLGAAAGIGVFILAETVADQVQVRLSFPLELHLTLDVQLLAVVAVLAFLVTLLAGLAPALQVSNRSRHIASRQIGAESRSGWSSRRVLVTGQFALAFVLLVSAALFLRSLGRISRVDPGFDVKHLVTAEVSLDRNAYSRQRAAQYFASAIAEINRLPGVRSASGGAVVPLGLEHWVMSMKAGDQNIQRVFVNSVTQGYFNTMRIPLLNGRDFDESDRNGGRPVAIVNQTFANKYLHIRAVGSQVFIPSPGQPPTFSSVHIVGVVADSKYGSLGEDPTPALYWPTSQQYRALVIHISTQAPASGDVTAIRDVLSRLDPNAAVKIQLMQEQLAGAMLPSRIASVLLGVIGSLGLLLAVIGIYGVMAYSVSRRTAEIGMRLALGATRGQVLEMVLRDAGRLVCAGIGLGLLMALLVTQPLAGVLSSGMSVLDPMSFASVGAVLSVVALMAALIPAWAASRVDPVVALRSE